VLQPLSDYGRTPTEGRLLLYSCEKFADLERLRSETLSPNFALLTALDVRLVKNEEMARVAAVLIGRGLAYACCWGEDSERWHDAIDIADIERIKAKGEDYRNIVMTTWHSKESLLDALDFFADCALPTEAYAATCLDYVIAVPAEHEPEIRNAFTSTKSWHV
jgi:hypothetical protein